MSRLRVVIVGAGLAGLAVASDLRRAPVDITVIDRCGHRLLDEASYLGFAMAGLGSAGMPAPLRSITAGNPNAQALLDEVWGVDPAARQVRLLSGQSAAYDRLIIATGARQRAIGNDEWAEDGAGIRSLEDAIAMRRRVLFAIQRADAESDVARQRALLTFAVIGGGPAGVETAQRVASLAARTAARVLLIEGGSQLLPHFPPELSFGVQTALAQLGVEVVLGRPVTSIAPDHIVFGGERLDTFTAVWARGVQAPPAGGWLGVRIDAVGRLAVTPDLRVAGHDAIYAIGDTARFADAEGRLLPMNAQVAEQQGRHVAVAIASGIDRPFRFRDHGSRAAIAHRKSPIARPSASWGNAHQETDHGYDAAA